MTGEIETAGDLGAGALVARAFEPRAGESGGGHDPLCLNCAQRLDGPFCRNCGQAAHVHRTVAGIGHDLLHGVFHFEGKIWRTLPMLAFRPGELTRRYAAGERARFVSPMAIFLFSVFLMFAVVANLPGWNFDDGLLEPGVTGGVAEARIKLGSERQRAVDALSEARTELAEERADKQPDAERLKRLERRVGVAEKARRDLASAQAILPKPTTFDVEGTPEPTADNWLDQKFRHAKENPKLLLYKIKTSAYKYSWALIPLSLPFIWLLFPLRRDVGLYDHAIFATYSLTFMSLLVVVLAGLSALGLPDPAVWLTAMLVPPFHLYKQLKYGYQLGRAGALWRTAWMLIFAGIAAVLFVLLLLYLGVAD